MKKKSKKSKLKNATFIGQVAIFYIPTSKLDMQILQGTTRDLLHNFFVEHYNAYTHEISKIQGFWVKQDILVRDEHERFEVSFDGREKVQEFVNFLSLICGLIQEDSIYLTMGNKSWLITPEKQT